MPMQEITSPTIIPPRGDFSRGIIVPSGHTIYVAGHCATDADGRPVGKGDMETQTRVVMDAIGRVLEGAGAKWSDVVKLTTYLTNMADYRTYAAVKAEYLTERPFPASTAVEVSGLAHPDFLLEVEAIAVIPE